MASAWFSPTIQAEEPLDHFRLVKQKFTDGRFVDGSGETVAFSVPHRPDEAI